MVRIGSAARRALAPAALAVAAALLAGCNMFYGLGTDIQNASDATQALIFTDDPAFD